MRAVTLAAIVVIASGTARAEPPDPGTIADANAGHVWLVPTALVPAPGTWSLEDVELIGLGGSYTIIDHVIASATAFVNPLDGTHVFAIASVKAQVLRASRLRLAALVGGHFGYDHDSGGTSSEKFVDGAVVATICIDGACASHVDAAVGVGLGHDTVYPSRSIPFGFGGALVARLWGPLKLLVEVDELWDVMEPQITLGIVGIRVAMPHGGLDAGWGECFAGSGDCSSPRGFPVLQFSYRR